MILELYYRILKRKKNYNLVLYSYALKDIKKDRCSRSLLRKRKLILRRKKMNFDVLHGLRCFHPLSSRSWKTHIKNNSWGESGRNTSCLPLLRGLSRTLAYYLIFPTLIMTFDLLPLFYLQVSMEVKI